MKTMFDLHELTIIDAKYFKLFYELAFYLLKTSSLVYEVHFQRKHTM